MFGFNVGIEVEARRAYYMKDFFSREKFQRLIFVLIPFVFFLMSDLKESLYNWVVLVIFVFLILFGDKFSKR